MERIWEFFENMNEFVYVTDMDSYELVYMNRKTRDTYGICSMDELAGKKCYEVLQGNSTPCTICNSHELCPGYFKEWRYYNPVLGRHLALKDTMLEENGRRFRIEIAMDASAQEQQSKMIRNYENLEALVNEGFRLALQTATPDQSIDVILEYLGKALNGERTYIFEKNESGGDDNTYEWVANGVTPEKENLQNLPPEVCANWYRNFRENRNIIIEDLEDIREEDPLQYENLKRQNIHSLVVVPLYDENRIIGFYGVDNPPGKKMDYARNMLEITGYFIISSLKRRDLLKQLQNMSYRDPLTLFGNRFAMSEYVDHIQTGESIGVVYCDITGLKQVNDTEGHEAGDQLILRACSCLKDTFDGYGLFRIGGDELLALCPQIKESILKNKVELLKKNMKDHSVNMAVGAVWKENCTESIDSLLTESEKLMYKDKALYYKTVGADRRNNL